MPRRRDVTGGRLDRAHLATPTSLHSPDSRPLTGAAVMRPLPCRRERRPAAAIERRACKFVPTSALTVKFTPMSQRPEIVCICGSMRFAEDIREANGQLTSSGVIVLAPGETSLAATGPVTAELKERLDALHRHKIDLSDRVLVVNPGGYVGESTRAEIAYARASGKPVSFSHPC